MSIFDHCPRRNQIIIQRSNKGDPINMKIKDANKYTWDFNEHGVVTTNKKFVHHLIFYVVNLRGRAQRFLCAEKFICA